MSYQKENHESDYEIDLTESHISRIPATEANVMKITFCVDGVRSRRTITFVPKVWRNDCELLQAALDYLSSSVANVGDIRILSVRPTSPASVVVL